MRRSRVLLFILLSPVLLAFECQCEKSTTAPESFPDRVRVFPDAIDFSSLEETQNISFSCYHKSDAVPCRGVGRATSDPSVVTTVPQYSTNEVLLTSHGNGTATVSVSADGWGDRPVADVLVTVRQIPVGVDLAPSTVSLTGTGDTQQLTATVSDANGHEIEDAQVTWTSLSPAVASVTSGGLVTAVGPGTAEIRANAEGTSDSGSSMVTVTATAVVISSSAVADGMVGYAYSGALSATGGDGTFTWSNSSGIFPPGLTLSSSGQITGTPTAAGVYDFAVKVSSGGAEASKGFLLRVWDQLVIADGELATGVTGGAYSDSLTATGGDGFQVWSLYFGDLQAGLTFSSWGAVFGTPTVRGTKFLTFQVVSAGFTARADRYLSVVELPQVTTTALPDGYSDTAYSQQLAMSGGTGVLTDNSWTLVSGSLPPGLTLNANGVVSGTPSGLSHSSFRVRVTVKGFSAEGNATLIIR